MFFRQNFVKNTERDDLIADFFQKIEKEYKNIYFFDKEPYTTYL